MARPPLPEFSPEEAKTFLATTYHSAFIAPFTEEAEGVPDVEETQARFENAAEAKDMVVQLDAHLAMEVTRARYALDNPNAAGDMWAMIEEKDRGSVPEQFLKSTDQVMAAESERLVQATDLRMKLASAAKTLEIDYVPFKGGDEPQLH